MSVFFHLNLKPISRTSGRTATGAVAYRSGECLRDYTGNLHDYTRKRGVLYTEILLPQETPDWAQDRQRLWVEADNAERRKNSTVAREMDIALPTELDPGERLCAVKNMAKYLVDTYGVSVDIALHKPDKNGQNYHAHLLFSTRALGSDGFGAKTRILDDIKTGPGEVKKIREKWEEILNTELERIGVKERVDCRSLKAQGIGRIPLVHEGPEDAPIYAIRHARNETIRAENTHREKIRETAAPTPEPILAPTVAPISEAPSVDADEAARAAQREAAAQKQREADEAWLQAEIEATRQEAAAARRETDVHRKTSKINTLPTIAPEPPQTPPAQVEDIIPYPTVQKGVEGVLGDTQKATKIASHTPVQQPPTSAAPPEPTDYERQHYQAEAAHVALREKRHWRDYVDARENFGNAEKTEPAKYKLFAHMVWKSTVAALQEAVARAWEVIAKPLRNMILADPRPEAEKIEPLIQVYARDEVIGQYPPQAVEVIKRCLAMDEPPKEAERHTEPVQMAHPAAVAPPPEPISPTASAAPPPLSERDRAAAVTPQPAPAPETRLSQTLSEAWKIYGERIEVIRAPHVAKLEEQLALTREKYADDPKMLAVLEEKEQKAIEMIDQFAIAGMRRQHPELIEVIQKMQEADAEKHAGQQRSKRLGSDRGR
jgi:hypothetical protein